MKTKLRKYLIHLRDNLSALKQQRMIAEKLEHHVQCASFSKRINDCENVIKDIELIINS